ncbi:hypothetical protein GC194_04900 [bacterium]|nr:hypothetical protein [bacterium]
MKLLSHCNEVIFERRELETAYRLMAHKGTSGMEGVALFAGRIDNDRALVKETIIPEQENGDMEDGLYFSVGQRELKRIARYLYSRGLILIAQIHSHPADAYHSAADDRYPIITELGAISIVVPDFANSPINYLNWAYYRLIGRLQWEKLSNREISKQIKINGFS